MPPAQSLPLLPALVWAGFLPLVLKEADFLKGLFKGSPWGLKDTTTIEGR